MSYKSERNWAATRKQTLHLAVMGLAVSLEMFSVTPQSTEPKSQDSSTNTGMAAWMWHVC